MAKPKRTTRTAPKPKTEGSVVAASGPPSKAERRDQARQERHALQRKMARRRRLGRLTTRVVIVLAVLGAAAGVLILTRSSSPKTGPAPWPANTDKLKVRLSALGLPALSAEGTTLHIHQHLDLYVNGTKQVVPAQIGILTSPHVVFSPLHTHDTTGIIHVESPTVRSFTLGEFFDVWGVRFTPTCLGGYCNQG